MAVRTLHALAAALGALQREADSLAQRTPLSNDEASVRLHSIHAEERRVLDDLRSSLDDHAVKINRLEDLIADRFNNVLMSVQTISDRMRRLEPSDNVEQLREQLTETISVGRETMQLIRRDLEAMR